MLNYFNISFIAFFLVHSTINRQPRNNFHTANVANRLYQWMIWYFFGFCLTF